MFSVYYICRLRRGTDPDTVDKYMSVSSILGENGGKQPQVLGRLKDVCHKVGDVGQF